MHLSLNRIENDSLFVQMKNRHKFLNFRRMCRTKINIPLSLSSQLSDVFENETSASFFVINYRSTISLLQTPASYHRSNNSSHLPYKCNFTTYLVVSLYSSAFPFWKVRWLVWCQVNWPLRLLVIKVRIWRGRFISRRVWVNFFTADS